MHGFDIKIFQDWIKALVWYDVTKTKINARATVKGEQKAGDQKIERYPRQVKGSKPSGIPVAPRTCEYCVYLFQWKLVVVSAKEAGASTQCFRHELYATQHGGSLI